MRAALLASVTGMVLLAGCATHAKRGPENSAAREQQESAPGSTRWPDEERLGRSQGFPSGSRESWLADESRHVGSFSHFESIFPHRVLPQSQTPTPLRYAKNAAQIRYRFGGKEWSIDDFLARQRITGLLIIRDGEILAERYQYDRQADQKLLSFSIAKSITSLAIGLALDEGKIRSLDDKVAQYVPELKGYPYGETSIRNLLRMASGVKFSETYLPHDDLSRFIAVWKNQNLVSALQAFSEKNAPEGARFDYATSNTYLLGLLVARATGTTLSEYVGKKIWQPMGAESEAMFGIETDGNEYAGTRFMAVLRDYGRLGLLLANDGNVNGRQIIPKSYLLDATDATRQPAAFGPGRATPYFGYGYQFWLLPGARRQFMLNGVHGQAVYVDPESRTVLVHTGVAKNANIFVGDPLGPESLALWQGLTSAGQAASPAPVSSLPAGINQLTEAASAAFRNNDLEALKAIYHPRFLHSGRNREQQMQFLGSQAMGRIKRMEMKIDRWTWEGKLVNVNAMILTEAGDFPTETKLIEENGRWYFYGNQQQ